MPKHLAPQLWGIDKMKQRIVPTLATLYFLAMLVAVTFPGYLPFNRIRPFVLGMPFSLFWQLIWISGAVVVLGLAFLWEKKRKRESPRFDRPSEAADARGD